MSNLKNKKLPKYILELINARKKARKVSKNDSKKDIYNKYTSTLRKEIKAINDDGWKEFVGK